MKYLLYFFWWYIYTLYAWSTAGWEKTSWPKGESCFQKNRRPTTTNMTSAVLYLHFFVELDRVVQLEYIPFHIHYEKFCPMMISRLIPSISINVGHFFRRRIRPLIPCYLASPVLPSRRPSTEVRRKSTPCLKRTWRGHRPTTKVDLLTWPLTSLPPTTTAPNRQKKDLTIRWSWRRGQSGSVAAWTWNPTTSGCWCW